MTSKKQKIESHFYCTFCSRGVIHDKFPFLYKNHYLNDFKKGVICDNCVTKIVDHHRGKDEKKRKIGNNETVSSLEIR